MFVTLTCSKDGYLTCIYDTDLQNGGVIPNGGRVEGLRFFLILSEEFLAYVTLDTVILMISNSL